MKKFILFVLFCLLLLTGVVQAEHQMTKWDLIAKARHGTGLEPDDSTATIAVRSAMDFIQSAALYPVCIDTHRVDLAANTELYALPADCYEPIVAYISPTGRVLDWTTVQNKQRIPSATSEAPDRVFYVQDDSVKLLGFDPVPTSTDSVQLVYEVSATEIVFGSGANAQRVRVREVYHPALVAAVKAYLWESYGRENKANRYLDKATWLINVAERKLGTPPVDLMVLPKAYPRP